MIELLLSKMIGTVEVGSAEVDSPEVGIFEVVTDEVSTVEVGTAEVGAAEVGTAQGDNRRNLLTLSVCKNLCRNIHFLAMETH